MAKPVEERVKEIIVEQLGVEEDEVLPAAKFIEDLGADSLDTVELVMAFEEEFDLEIPDEDAEKIATVGDAISYIKENSVGAGARRGAWTRVESSSPGSGAVTPVGNTAEEFWTALTQGKSGIGPITRFDASPLPTRIAGEVKGFDSLRYIDKKDDRKFDPFLKYAVACGVMAVEDVGPEPGAGGQDPLRRAGGLRHRRDHHAAGDPQGAAREGAGPRVALLHPDADREHGVRAHLDALRRQGAELLGGDRLRDRQPRDRRRDADHPARRRRRHDRGRGRGHHHPPDLRGLLPDEGDVAPGTTIRPAPRARSTPTRDGFVCGEGGGLVVLESLDHALAPRRADLRGGGGLRHDRRRLPHDRAGSRGGRRRAGHGRWRCATRASSRRRSATSTPTGPPRPTTTSRRPWRSSASSASTPGKLAVSSTKSMTGHLLGAAGGIEAIATAFAIHHGILPPDHQLRDAGSRLRPRLRPEPGAQAGRGGRAQQRVRLRRARTPPSSSGSIAPRRSEGATPPSEPPPTAESAGEPALSDSMVALIRIRPAVGSEPPACWAHWAIPRSRAAAGGAHPPLLHERESRLARQRARSPSWATRCWPSWWPSACSPPRPTSRWAC